MSLYNGASTSNFREYANNQRFNDAIKGSWSIWVNPTASAPGVQQIWVARGDGTISGEFTLGTPASGTFQRARASVTTSSGLQSVSDTVDWIQRKWFHYGQTYDGTTMRLYIDGRERVNGVAVGSFTITTTKNVRLWMRTNAANPGDHYIENFGWWRTVLTPAEMDYLARGGDFTRVRRDDALLLDPLQDLNRVELVAGLGVNTGTLSVREAAPIILRSPNAPLAKPFLFPVATRKRYSIGVPGAAPSFDATRFLPFFN